jgi:predicted RNase H-like nuclease
MVILAGVDLAWSGRKPTGVCVVNCERERVRIEALGCFDFDAAGAFGFLEALGPNVIAGIDAPLVVGPNRSAEAELARAYGNRGVYAYAARADFLDRHGISEGPRLGAMLAEAGWNLDPAAVAVTGRHALEVFPHATTVSLLGAARVLRYKKGRLAARHGPLAEFGALLRGWAAGAIPELAPRIEELLPSEPLPGREMKAIEDQLDAIACVAAAHRAWRNGAAGLHVFGSAGHGYIAVPRREGLV